jgi:prepilin-type N-terminal cleavage/methylation domain-containing protein
MNNRIKKTIKNNKGMTLVEVIVAVTLFSFTIVYATEIFQTVMSGQYGSMAATNIQESMRFTLEVMGKEIKTAKKHTGICEAFCGFGTMTNPIYNANVAGDILCFYNEKSVCVKYYLENNRLKIERELVGDYYITPDDIKMTDLKFIVYEAANLRPRATIMFGVDALGPEKIKQPIKIQETIASRNYLE